MKGAPMHDLSGKHGTNANYKKSGAPGLLGKILDPLGLAKKAKGLFGKKGGGANCPPAGAAGAAGAAAGATPGVQGPAVPPDEQAGPVVDPAAAAPMQMRKQSPAKDIRKSWHYGGGQASDPGHKKHNKRHTTGKVNPDHTRKKEARDNDVKDKKKGPQPFMRDGKVIDGSQSKK